MPLTYAWRSTNDGKELVGVVADKTVDVWKAGNGSRVVAEKVFVYSTTVGIRALTESQAGHLKQLITGLGYGSGGEVLAVDRGQYLSALCDLDHGAPTYIAVINPTVRGVNSNRILLSLPKPTQNYWSVGSGSAAAIAVGYSPVRFYRVTGIGGAKPAIQSAGKESGPPRGLRLADVDPARKIALLLSQAGEGIVARADSSQAKPLHLPRPLAFEQGTLRFAGNRFIVTYRTGPQRQPLQGGISYISTKAGGWKEIGPYEMIGRSFDRKLVILRGQGQVWLCPADRL